MPHRTATLLLSLSFFAVSSSCSSVASAEPWFGWGENAAEDRFADGDLDEEDHVAMHIGAHPVADVDGVSWVSLAGFHRQLLDGRTDVGGLVVVGLALDRTGQGPAHRIAEPASVIPTPSSPGAGLLVAPALARECVAAAWRVWGLEGDARIDSMASRSRSSALLPETRVRAMRLWSDAARATTLATTDGTSYYDTVGAHLVLELRLTWRLDRIVYAGDEPALERIRMERQDARSRVATRTLETLFAWERASLDVRETGPGSHGESEALLRMAQAEATLDVLTGGWFSATKDRRTSPP